MEDKNKKIEELEARIADLELHRDMWFRAGGMGGRMAVQAMEEIKVLKIRLEDLKNGTHYDMRLHLKNLISQLQYEQKTASIFHKKWYQDLIDAHEKELKELQLIDAEIEKSLVGSKEEEKEEEKSHSK